MTPLTVSASFFKCATFAAPPPPLPYLFIFNGESNSGGYALNSQAPIDEIGVRNSVQILNNTTLVFESLNIGANNLIDHAGLTNGVTHGFELEIANQADSVAKYSGVHIIKTGQGGSTISQWGTAGTYFTKFAQRVNAAKELINFSQYNVAVLFSLGINDAIANTNVTTWKAAVIAHLAELRAVIGRGNVPIVMTEFQGMGAGGSAYAAFSTAVQEIASEVPNVFSIDATSAGRRDVNHWNYSGMKTITQRLLAEI